MPLTRQAPKMIRVIFFTASIFLTAFDVMGMNAVYVQSNEAANNEVALLTQANQVAPLIYVASYLTGGKGDRSIDGNQSHALASDGKHLFATNAGDDSISVFQIGRSGSLTLLTTTASRGRHPVSLAVIGDRLIVVNQGDVNPKSPINPNIQGFRILSTGALVPLRGGYTYLPRDVPVDIIGTSRSPIFSVVLSGTSEVDTFQLGLDGSMSRTGTFNAISNPLGGAIGRLNPYKLGVTLADDSLPGVASLTFSRDGVPERVSQIVRPNLKDPCWATANASGTLLWTSAFETRTISLYWWGKNGEINSVSDFTPENYGPGGLDVTLSHNDRNLFWLRVGDPLDNQASIRPYIITFEVNQSLLNISAGLRLIGKSWLPEKWGNSNATGLLSVRVKQ
ncbi:MAG: hypothetical protein RL333_2178 [Pseudomonadota bacterium]